MKLTIKSNVDNRTIVVTGDSYYDCICNFICDSNSKLAGFVELEAEEIREKTSPMVDDEEIGIEAFESVLKTYGCEFVKEGGAE